MPDKLGWQKDGRQKKDKADPGPQPTSPYTFFAKSEQFAHNPPL
jgi:hypothetical protein